MKKLIATLTVWAFPVLVWAQGIVPCNPTFDKATNKMINECGFCEVKQLIKNFSDWFVLISGILVVLIIIGAGLRLAMSQDVGAKSTMRRFLTTALFGYMIVIGAWVMVDLILKFTTQGTTQASEYGVFKPLVCP